MKYLCPGCERLVELSRFQLAADGALELTCAACGQRARASSPPGPAAPPAQSCPKCGAARTAGQACPVCGLSATHFDAGHFAAPAWLAARWSALEARWGDQAAHEALRREALEQGALEALGRCYRARLAKNPQDAVALSARDELLQLALVAHAATSAIADREPSAEGRRPSSRAFLAVVLVALLLGLAVGFSLLSLKGGRA